MLDVFFHQTRKIKHNMVFLMFGEKTAATS